MASFIFALDAHLRRRQSIYEFTRDPRCILRVKTDTADCRCVFCDGETLQAGDPVLDLHLWNEHLPLLDRESLAWSREMTSRFIFSMRELAAFLESSPDLENIKALRANVGFATADQKDQIVRILGRWGFHFVETGAPRTFLERLHLLGGNILISLMVLARNVSALRAGSLRRERLLFFLSRASLERRFGEGRSAKVRAARG